METISCLTVSSTCVVLPFPLVFMCLYCVEIVYKSQTLAGREEFESSLLLLRFLSQLPVETETGKVKRAGEILFKHMAKSDL